MLQFQKNSSDFHTKITYHYLEFKPAQPSWSQFDISSCVDRSNQMFLKVTLEGKV